jgi:predicted secreted hydrolase
MIASSSIAQGFAGLGTTAKGFSVPERGIPLRFPASHGPHPDYRIEWWYLTANLMGEDGAEYGAQWTLFRSAIAPGEKGGWASPQLWLGHAGVTTANKQFVAEKLARGGIGQAGVTIAPFAAWIDDWGIQQTRSSAGDADELSAINVIASAKDFGYDLNLETSKPLVLQGDKGYSTKSADGQASYYYSQPFYTVHGTLHLPERNVAVTGQAWLDREWSSQPLSPRQTGWDWFSLHLDSGEKVMGFKLRDAGEGYTSATWIDHDGVPTALAPGELKLTPIKQAVVAGRDMPIEWKVEIPSKNFSITTTPLNPQAWMATTTPYWEGPIRFSGTYNGKGYLEMTGY